MYMRAVTVRVVYLAVLSVGVLFGTAFRQSVVLAAPAQAVAPKREQTVTAPAPVLLQTIHVRAQAARVVAPAGASNVKVLTATPAVEVRPAPSDLRERAALPTLRLDMPYYSIGKMLPRVGKE
jgi:hypothetical protein